ncbi:MAG: gliding motility-associated C-terminal domain-containing protein, partial [Phycisphaerae bacterium]|nr:gliding motility-associated C-terminal domain-containing protein [Saprospiraceae bacterium]
QSFFAVQAFNSLQPGNYDLVVQDANGCEITAPILVPSPLMPLVTSPLSIELELGQNQEIHATVPPSFPIGLVDTVIWTPMTGLVFEGNNTFQLLNPVAQPFTSTQYTVTIITTEGCQSSARTIVKVDREANIYVPNIIWPEDPDGNNATFLIFARDESIARIKKLEIFDRWGSLIFANMDFRPNDPSAGWNGVCRGVPVNPAVYVWWAEVELVDGREVLIKGDVTVVR